MDIKILLENEHEVAVIKPVGVDAEKEMPELLAAQLGGTFYCVHRLDRAVGGVMVYARDRETAAFLSEEIRGDRLTKEYLCLCEGSLDPRKGQMKDLMIKDSVRQKAYVTDRPRKGVKEAVLYYEVLKTLQEGRVSLVHVVLETGRYHQIRAQFAARRHPLLGDGKYGSRTKRKEIALYSVRLSWKNQTVTWIPEDLKSLVTAEDF